MPATNTMNVAKKAGRFDFSFDEPSLAASGSGAVFLTDAPDGPLAMFIALPGDVEAPAHSHDSDSITVVLEGSIRVGKKWYRQGSIRVQDKGSIYGPALTGPEGVKTIVFFADRRGLPDRFAREEDVVKHAEMIAVLEAFVRGECPLPNFMEDAEAGDPPPMV